MGREMVGVELKKAFSIMAITADDDVFATLATEFMFIHDTPEKIKWRTECEVAHATCRWCGKSGRRKVLRDDVLQTVQNDIFQVFSHVV